MARRQLVAVVGAFALSAACGTTVSTTGATPTGDLVAQPGAAQGTTGGTDGFGAPTGTSGGASSGSTATSADSRTTTGGTSGTSGKSGDDAATGASPTTPSGTPPSGQSVKVPSRAPGVTDEYVFAGLYYSSDAAAGNAAIGATGATPTYDFRDVYMAAIDHANTHGGFAGRKLKPLWFDFSVSQDANTQAQAACEHWTKDNQVFAMDGGDEILNQCAENGKAIALGSGSSATFQRYPHLVAPNDIAIDRLGTVTVNGLHKAGYFAGKLGLVTWDDPDYKRSITDGYLPTLKKYGISPEETAYIGVPQQIGALGDMTAAVSSAITKFRAEGIDHVIIQDGPAGVWAGNGLTFQWMNQAKSQRYYPRYGQNSNNSPGWVVFPKDQMDKAIAIDQTDYDKKHDEGWKLNQVREKCYQIMKDAGLPVSSSNSTDQIIAAVVCDRILFLQRVINLLSVIDNDSFVAALPRLGSSLGSAAVYGNNFVPGRRDGGSHVRPAVYDMACECLKYLGPPYDAS